MAGRSWDEIPQESWDDIRLHVHEDGEWSLSFTYTGANGVEYSYPEEWISWEDFLNVYDEAGALDQEIEIIADT
jgi:hypothetical protein